MPTPSPAPENQPGVTGLPPRLLLYDGVCGLCHRTVGFLLAHDPHAKLAFAPLQGPTADRCRALFPNIPHSLDTLVYVSATGATLRSKAVFQAMGHLGYPWRALSWLRWLPPFLSDLGYRMVASSRYRVFGKYDTCRLPVPSEAARFLP